ncbi:hypothetical protein [Bradyrhizobium sp. CSA112]|uniref:hypothetical protein n=1 Tax=Bradyrhizobium sp. CSA112 TaxID=2699170 RepID=UPI0023AF6D36|nr:hypothetical protein [Bradyrhizobium sp. CSA112]
MFLGILLFIAGMFIATQNTQSKIAWPLIIVGLVLIAVPVRAHDHDHPELDAWYAGLMQPDNPTASCCGKTDAYWCDDYYARDGKAYCRITDDRVVDGRPPVPVGTEIEIPARKLKWDRGNPTGHSVVFLSSGGSVFCFVQAGGV